MPSNIADSETAAMYKQVLLRPLSVPRTDTPADVQVLEAFAPLCEHDAGATAFNQNWLNYEEKQRKLALEARAKFLHRYEWPSLW